MVEHKLDPGRKNPAHCVAPPPSDPSAQRSVGLTQVAEAAVEPRVTEAGPVEAVAAAPVGTVALLTAVLAIEAFGAAWGKGGLLTAHPDMASHPRRCSESDISTQYRSLERPGPPGYSRRASGPPEAQGPCAPDREGPLGWRGPPGAGQDEVSPMNVAVCPCGPVPPGSAAPDGGQTGGHHIFTTCRSDSESPRSPSDWHRQHPDACPSVVIEPGLRNSQREGHRPKFKGPRARAGLCPPPQMLHSDSALPLTCLLKGFRDLHGDPKERPHPGHPDLLVGPSWTVPAS